MNPRVVSAEPMDDFKLFLIFTNGEERVFDCKPYLGKGIFRLLQDRTYFAKLQVVNGTVQWADEQDFCPDTLYLESKPAIKMSA